YRAGFMPWKYPRFLDYASERILLRKVGGGYIFVHRLLLEYFAALESEPTSTIKAERANLPALSALSMILAQDKDSTTPSEALLPQPGVSRRKFIGATSVGIMVLG